MAARSNAWVYGRWFPGIRVRIPPKAWMSVSCVVRCQVEASALGWSFVQRSPTECVVTECDRAASIMRKGDGLLRTVAPWERENLQRIGCKDGTFVGLTVDSI